MATKTYIPIAKATPSGVSDVTLSSIPSTYTDLVLIISFRNAYANPTDYVTVQPNASTSSHSHIRLQSDGSTVTSAGPGASSAYWFYRSDASGNTSNTFSSHELYIPNYAGSTNKVASYTGVVEGNTTTAGNTYIQAVANLWSNTNAITSLKIGSLNDVFSTGTTIDLYGII